MKRVLITGMGTQLGARVAQVLDDDPAIDAIVGTDTDPPRLRLRRAEFHRVDLRDRERMAKIVTDVEPDTLFHLGVFEPGARWPSPIAERRTLAGTRAVLDAVVETACVTDIVVRSGIEVYGRGGRAPDPDESTAVSPSTSFGRTLVRVEEAATAAGVALGYPVGILRLAPLMGAHGPSPLARYIRLPVVPIPNLGLARFAVVYPDDAAAAVVAAAARGTDGVVDVVAPGTVSVIGAVRSGGRLPLLLFGPTWGPAWLVARRVTEFVGAPLPDHVLELLQRGRRADGNKATTALGVTPASTTQEVIQGIQTWTPI